jgi:5-methyltetrahydropteroyltriglutamate--homocysteine methyltransferase
MVEVHLAGIFPRSEQLVQVTRAAARGKATQSEVDAILYQDVKALVALQKAAGLEYVVDGQINWQDLFRPFSELLTGIRPSSVTRWFDNNTFYRKPVITEKVRFRGNGTRQYFRDDLLPRDIAKKAVLPGPFTFAAMSENETYASLADLVDDIAHALRDLAKELSKTGYSFFQFNEPSLCYGRTSKDDLKIAAKAYEICARGINGRTCVQTYFGDASGIIDALLDFPTDSIGLDLYATPLDTLPDHDFNKGLGCGCIDGRNSLLESPEDLNKLISKIKEEVCPRDLFVCPNCDLEFLPYPIAEKKVLVLSKTKRLIA